MAKDIILQNVDVAKLDEKENAIVIAKAGKGKGFVEPSLAKACKNKNNKPVAYAVGEVWNVFPVPLVMTELEARVRFYTVGSDDKPRRLVANGIKDRLSNTYQIMLMKGERKRLMAEYHVSSNELYRYLNLELRRSVDMMELHPDKYLIKLDENDL